MERREYSNEFKEETMKLVVRGDVGVSQVAKDLEVNTGLLHKWVRQFGMNGDGTKSVTPDELLSWFVCVASSSALRKSVTF